VSSDDRAHAARMRTPRKNSNLLHNFGDIFFGEFHVHVLELIERANTQLKRDLNHQ
jgi:hypothetical protein